MIYRRIHILLSLLLLLIGCSENHNDRRLVHIADMVSESPIEALDSLDSIDYSAPSTPDQYFYDFLTIKAQDKAYITHTSDSLFIHVLDYYSNNLTSEIYPEVLYYGGRVYSDLGDYPTALNYFQKALDYLPANTHNTNLRSKVLSQTGRLLNSLRLYNEAIPYIKSAIEIDQQFNDSINEIYDIQLLGTVYLRAHDYPNAEYYFRSALNKSLNLPISHKAKSSMYLAGVKFRLGQIDSALIYIRDTPNLVKPIAKNSALACAAEIYHAAGIRDTAYRYAYELINSDDYTNKETGYQVILSPDLRPLTSFDTINTYLSEYLSLLESYFNENENQLALNQQNLYNYQLHEREKAKAEASKKTLWKWIIVLIFATITMGMVILFLKNRDKNHIIELQHALEYINNLEQELKANQNVIVGNNHIETDEDHVDNAALGLPILGSTKNTEHELRERLRNKLMSLYESYEEKPTVSHIILQSEPYQTLLNMIRDGKAIREDDKLWLELEQVVLQCSPKFKSNLNLLTLGRLTMLDLHTSLLIKFGIKPSQMTILLGQSNGAIISRRESLCLKVLDKKLGVKVIDGIIRLL